MKCVSPESIPRPNGRGAKDRIIIPCGKCLPCKMRKRSSWSFRLVQELRYSKSAYFVTLTYDDIHVPCLGYVIEPDVVDEGIIEMKREAVLFFKLLRKRNKQLWPKVKLSYYLTAERGAETKRPHFHAIIFNLNDDYEKSLLDAWKDQETKKPKGMIQIYPANEAMINYVTGYFLEEEKDTLFNHISKGLGLSYLQENGFHHRDNDKHYVTTSSGVKVNMPRYYKNKIFNETQKLLFKNRALKSELLSYNQKLEKYTSQGYSNYMAELSVARDEAMQQKQNNIKPKSIKKRKL